MRQHPVGHPQLGLLAVLIQHVGFVNLYVNPPLFWTVEFGAVITLLHLVLVPVVLVEINGDLGVLVRQVFGDFSFALWRPILL